MGRHFPEPLISVLDICSVCTHVDMSEHTCKAYNFLNYEYIWISDGHGWILGEQGRVKNVIQGQKLYSFKEMGCFAKYVL